MAQIIKHRRGQIQSVNALTARNGEFIVASGSISDLQGPFSFIGSPNPTDNNVAGAWLPISKVFVGDNAPTIANATYGTTLDGTPFYSTLEKTFYILKHTTNTKPELTGNIEGGTVSGLTITSLSSTNINATNITGSNFTGSFAGAFSGDGSQLTGISAENVDGISVNSISTGSVSATISEALGLVVNTSISSSGNISGSSFHTPGNLTVGGSTYLTGLTDTRVLVAGAGGLVTNYSGLTFNDTQLSVGGGNLTVQKATGNVLTKGTLGVESNLAVTGTTTLGSTLTVNSNSTLNGTLTVTGTTTSRGDLVVSGSTTLADSTYVETLTENRVVLAGVNGLLEDDANFVFDGTKLNIGAGDFEVDALTGDIRTSGSLTVQNGQTINGNATVNGNLVVTGTTTLQNNLYVSGNLEVYGSTTEVHISSSTVMINDNIITLNAYSPFERYGGIEVIDSGSTGVSASIVWDSLNDYWMFVSSSGQSMKFIGTTPSVYGSENSLTVGSFPIATTQKTLGDSLLSYSGTTLALNTNVFTVDSTSGATLISGGLTLSFSGGTDNGSKGSGVVYRNSSNVLGFVATTETTDVLDGLLGYANSGGTLKFSTVIDGGTY